MAKKKIVGYSLDVLQGVRHRAGIFECPHCDHEPKSHRGWVDQALRLCLAIVDGKHGSAAVVSECPKCFKLSWVHQDLERMREYSGYPVAWERAAEEERARRHVEALRHWAAGICARCRHLTDGEVTTSDRRTCKIGFGSAVTECNYFEEIKRG